VRFAYFAKFVLFISFAKQAENVENQPQIDVKNSESEQMKQVSAMQMA
jgi:hypothetical protein